MEHFSFDQLGFQRVSNSHEHYIQSYIQSIAILDILDNHRQSKFETTLSDNFKI